MQVSRLQQELREMTVILSIRDNIIRERNQTIQDLQMSINDKNIRIRNLEDQLLVASVTSNS